MLISDRRLLMLARPGMAGLVVVATAAVASVADQCVVPLLVLTYHRARMRAYVYTCMLHASVRGFRINECAFWFSIELRRSGGGDGGDGGSSVHDAASGFYFAPVIIRSGCQERKRKSAANTHTLWSCRVRGGKLTCVQIRWFASALLFLDVFCAASRIRITCTTEVFNIGRPTTASEQSRALVKCALIYRYEIANLVLSNGRQTGKRAPQ